MKNKFSKKYKNVLIIKGTQGMAKLSLAVVSGSRAVRRSAGELFVCASETTTLDSLNVGGRLGSTPRARMLNRAGRQLNTFSTINTETEAIASLNPRARRSGLLWSQLAIAMIALLMPVAAAFAPSDSRLPLSPEVVNAATSNQLNFQGRLLTASGALVPDGVYNMQFDLYNVASGGSSLWTEDRLVTNTQGVSVQNGYYSIYLGQYDAFPAIDWSQDLYLGMTIRGTASCVWGSCTPADSEMTPRFKLTAVPYAFRASNVASSSTNAASSNSDGVSITTGNALGATSNSGNITVDVGTATGTAGTISLGSANASALTIGRSGVTTTLQGSISLTGAGTALSVTNDATIGGALQVNGNTTLGNNASADTLTVNAAATFTGNLTINTGNTFTNAGSSLFTAQAVSNLATGGNIGTAAATVDVATTFNVNQTTAAQTITLPAPTVTTAGRVVYVNNVGSASFTMYGSVIGAGQSNAFIWNGTAWVTTVSLSGSVVNVVGTLDSQTKSADGAVISSNAIYLQTADASFAGLVSTGTQTFAGAKTFNGLVTASAGLTVSAGQSINLTGGNTASRPGTPTEGMIYFDTTTDSLITYANGKWQSDRGEYVIVAANDSTQAEKDSADYVADGTADQTEINSALTEASGGKVVLLAGTYVANATILVPNNTTLAGVGSGTVIELADIDATDNLIQNTDATTGTNITIRDLTIDGREDLNTAGTQIGIYLDNMGAVNTRVGASITGVEVRNFRTEGISLNSSDNNRITNNNIWSNVTGIGADDAFGNTINNNTFTANTIGDIALYNSGNTTVTGNTMFGYISILLDATSNSTITGNTVRDSAVGIKLQNYSSANTVSANTLSGTIFESIFLADAHSNIVSNNTIVDGFSTSGNGGITITNDSDENQIIGNTITDSSCDTTCYAIDINSASSNANYLEGNRYSDTDADSGDDATINDAGTGTIYAGQSTGATTGSSVSNFIFRGANSATAFAVQNASGSSVLNVNTSTAGVNVTGTLGVTGTATLGVASTTNGALTLLNSTNAFGVTLAASAQTVGNATISIPNTSGVADTFCLQTLGNCAGLGGLQAAYNADDDDGIAEIILTSTDGEILIRDAASTIGDLFVVEANGGADYLTVNSSALSLASATVNLNASSNFATNINTGTSTGAITIGNSAAGAIALQSASTVGVTGTTTITGLSAGAGTALTVNNSTSTGNVLVAQDNGTAVLTVADGGATTFKNQTDSRNGFNIQNAAGASLVNVSTATSGLNLISNPSFENGNVNGWINKGTGTVAIKNDTAGVAQFGSGVLQITTGTAANNGGFYRYPFKPSTQYSLSFWIKRSASTASTFNIGYDDDAGTDTNCLTGQTFNTTWTQFTCTFTTDSTISNGTGIYIKQTDTTTDTVYVDGFTLVEGATALDYTNVNTGSLVQVDASGGGTVTLLGNNSPTIGDWRSTSDLPLPIDSQGVVVVNGNIYSIGGYDNNANDSTDAVYQAKLNGDGSVSAWTELTSTPLPQELFDLSVVAYNGYIYASGGYDANAFTRYNDVYVAKVLPDGTLTSWTQTTDLPHPELSMHTTVVANGYMYLISGQDASTDVDDVYSIKINANGTLASSWTSLGTMDYRTNAHAVYANGYIYVPGGNSSSLGSTYNTVYYARVTANGGLSSWSTTTALPTNVSSNAVVVSNGYIYSIGGENAGVEASATYAARLNSNGTVGAWTANTSLPIQRTWSGHAVHNGYVYLVGGGVTSSGTGTATVIYSRLGGTLQVGGNLDLVGFQGQSLADSSQSWNGSVGGSITAGNGTFVGSLQVAGASTFNQGISVNGSGAFAGDLAVSGTISVATLGTSDTATYLCRNSSNIIAGCTVSPLSSSLTDNVTDSFDLQEGTNNYININTTNGSENISFGNATTNPSFSFLGSGTVTASGLLRAGTGGTNGTATGAGDLYVQDALEVDGGAVVTGPSGGSGTALTINQGTSTNVSLAINGAASTSANFLQITGSGEAYNSFVVNNTGLVTIRPVTGGDAVALRVQSADGTLTPFSVNTSTGLTSTFGQSVSGSIGLSGSISFSGSSSTSFTTPQGSTVTTRINIPLYDPGSANQLIAMGLPSGAATNSRGISLFDNRAAGDNQPVLSVFSPDETDVFGLSSDGSNAYGYLKATSGLGLGIKSGTTVAALFETSGNTTLNYDLAVNGGDLDLGTTGGTKRITSVGTGDFYTQTAAQSGASTNSGGFLFGTGSVSGATSDSGYVNLSTGNSSTSGNTGNLSIYTGNATSGNSGYITIDAGTASGSAGGIQIGNTNAASVLLGRTGITTTNAGALTVTEVLTANGNTVIGNANTDTLTINAGSSGTGITFGDSSFANCTLTTVSGALTCGSSGATVTLDTAYNNFGATPSKITVDAAEGQTGGLEFESTGTNNIFVDLQGTGDFSIQDAGTDVFTVDDSGNTTINGNLTFQSTTTSRVIAAAFDQDYSGSGSGAYFQTLSTNASTYLHVVPNGTGTTSGIELHDSGFDSDERGIIQYVENNGLQLLATNGLSNDGGSITLITKPGSGGSNTNRLVVDANGNATFNPTGTNSDFNVQGDTNANLFYVDASTDRIGIGTATPDEELEVNGFSKFELGNVNGSKGLIVTNRTSGSSNRTFESQFNGDTNFYILANGSTSIADDALYVDSADRQIGIGTATPDAALDIANGNISQAAWGLNGIQLQANSATYTDSSTAASGTATNAVFSSFATPTLAATNTSVTTTNAATVYIQGAPTAGSNQTITNPYAFWVDGGLTRLDGNLVIGDAEMGNAGFLAEFQGTTTASIAVTAGDATSSSVIYLGTEGNETGQGALSYDNNTDIYYITANGGSGTITLDANSTFTVGTAGATGELRLADGSSNYVTFNVNALAGDYTLSVPTITANDTLCLVTLGNCAGAGREFTAVVGTSVDSSNVSAAGYVANGDGGSAGDGDQAEINSAITAVNAAGGGTVYLLEGTYTIDATITLLDNVKIIGAGQDATVIQLRNSHNSTVGIFTAASGVEDWEIRDLSINGNHANQTSGTYYGVTASGSGGAANKGGTINNVEFYNFEDTNSVGVNLDTVLNVQITNSFFHDVYYGVYGLAAGTSVNMDISNNKFIGVTYAGVALDTITDVTVEGNSFIIPSSSNSSITLDSATGITISSNSFGGYDSAPGVVGQNTGVIEIAITGNSFEQQSASGVQGIFSNSLITGNSFQEIGNDQATNFPAIRVTSTTNTTISGNSIFSPTGDGIQLDSASGANLYNTITGNTIEGGDNGIMLESGSDYNVISSNTIFDNNNVGISLNVSDNNIISDNIVHDNGNNGADDGIALVGDSNDNQLIGNRITDTGTGTGQAIDISATSDNTYLADNTYSGTGASTITDAGTGTVYANQFSSSTTLEVRTATTQNLTLDTGTTGTVNLGTGTSGKTINIGTGAAAANTISLGGTGANIIGIGNTQTAGSISLGAALTTGTINIGGTGAQTGTIDIGVGTGAQAINLGTGAAAKTVTLGSSNTTSTTTIQGGSGAAAISLQAAASGTVVINDAGTDTDFRIEGDTDANLLFVDASMDSVGIGTATPDARLEIAGNRSQAAWGLNGIQLQAASATYTNTTSSGTVTNVVANSFGQPTFAASSAVTYSNAATLYIQNSPAAGSNVTLDSNNVYAFWVDAGRSRFDSSVIIGTDSNGGGTGSDNALTFIEQAATTQSALTVRGNGTGATERYGSVPLIQGRASNNEVYFAVGDSDLATLSLKATNTQTTIDLLNISTNAGSSGDILTITAAGLMGLGTTGPGRALEINSATGSNLRLTYNDNNGSATNYADLLVSSAGALTVDAVSYVRIGDSGTPGTANGDDDLYVEGDLEVDGGLVIGSDLAVTDITGTGLTISSGALGIDVTSASGFFQNGGNSFSGTATLGTNDSNSLILETNNTTALTVDTSQNVTLAGNLDVNGTAIVTDETGTFSLLNTNATVINAFGAASSIVAGAANGTTWFYSDELLVGFAGESYITGAGNAGLYVGSDSIGAGSGFTVFRSGNSTTGSTGDVSLVSGDAGAGNSGDIIINSGTATGTAGTISLGTANTSGISLGRTGISTQVAGDVNFDSNTLFVDESTNYVGIGTNAPDAKLHVQSTTSGENGLHVVSGQSHDTGFVYGTLTDLTVSPGADTGTGAFVGNAVSANIYPGATVANDAVVNFSSTGTFQSTGNLDYLVGYSSTFGYYCDPSCGTVNGVFGYVSEDPLSGGGTMPGITNNVGVAIEDRTRGTNQTNILINASTIDYGSVPSGSYSIYNGSTKDNLFAGDLFFGNGDATAMTVGTTTRTTNAAGANLTVQAGAAGSGASAFTGGVLTLQGGSAGGTGNANGGNVALVGGIGTGTGVKGLVLADTFALSTAATQNCTGTPCAITQANVDSYGAVLITTNASGYTVTLGDPTLGASATGRLIYVTNADATDDFVLSANGGSEQINLKPNTTATMIWNGSDWTAAGASSSTDLQAAYDNTAATAGGAEVVLSNSGTKGLTIRNDATSAIVGGLLEVQSSIGSNLFTVNNNAVEYADNGGAESSTFTMWTAAPTAGGTISQYTTAGDNIATGAASVSVDSTSTANTGVRNTLNATLTRNLKYRVSFAIRHTSSTTPFTTLDVRYSPTGTATDLEDCSTANTVNYAQWTRITCTFTYDNATTPNGSNAVLITHSDAVDHDYYIDNLSVTVSADVNHAIDGSVDVALGTNWQAIGGSVARSTSVLYDTSGSVQVTTSGTAGRGVYNNLTSGIIPQVSTQYRVAFYARGDGTNTATLAVAYTPDNNSTSVSCSDYNTQVVSATAYTLVTCLLTTSATTPVTSQQLRITQSAGSATTFYVDALTMTLNTNNSNNVQIGGANKGGPVTLFTLDRSNGAPIAANNDAYLGSMYYDTSSGRIQCYEADGWGACGAAPDNIVNLNPEYAGAVLNGSGVGTMTADFCSNQTGVLDVNTSLCSTGQAKNFYRWTSPQATQQTYSIYVTYQLPATFNGFSSDDTVQLTARVDNTSNASVTYEMFKSTGSAVTQCGTGETNVITGGGGSANTWYSYGISGNEATGCSFNSSSASNFVIFKINMKANSNANAYVSTLSFTTTGR